MKKLPRLVAASAAAVLALSVSACGGAGVAPKTSQGGAVPTPDENTGNTVPIDAFGAGCDSFPQGYKSGSLGTMSDEPLAVAASYAPRLTMLTSAINAAGLSDKLNFQSPAVTLFAPDNAAFEQLRQTMGPERFTAMMGDKAALTKLLSQHLVEQRNSRTTLVAAGTVPTLGGGNLQVASAGPGMTVSNGGTTATVVCGNIPTENGTMFVVDKVLAPPA